MFYYTCTTTTIDDGPIFTASYSLRKSVNGVGLLLKEVLL